MNSPIECKQHRVRQPPQLRQTSQDRAARANAVSARYCTNSFLAIYLSLPDAVSVLNETIEQPILRLETSLITYGIVVQVTVQERVRVLGHFARAFLAENRGGGYYTHSTTHPHRGDGGGRKECFVGL
jgi:hypothetical protein